MNPFAHDPLRTVDRRGRILAAATAAALVVPLVVACYLEPAAAGQGTHRQLGFPPCTMVALFGVRCPTCGMTTAWAHLVRGRLLEGALANTGGVLLGLAAIGSVIGLSATALIGRRPRWFPSIDTAAWLLTGIVAITLFDWAIRLWMS